MMRRERHATRRERKRDEETDGMRGVSLPYRRHTAGSCSWPRLSPSVHLLILPVRSSLIRLPSPYGSVTSLVPPDGTEGERRGAGGMGGKSDGEADDKRRRKGT